MDITRHIITQAVKSRENELIPIWDDRVIFEKTKMYGNVITLKDDLRKQHFNLVDCIYDLKTKKLDVGIELNYYPSEKDLEFKKDQVVLFEKSHRSLAESKILDIIYEEYDMEIIRGRKIDGYLMNIFKDIEIIDNSLYAIKRWKPFYLLDNGIKIKWEHQLFHKVENVIIK